jgi:transposase
VLGDGNRKDTGEGNAGHKTAKIQSRPEVKSSANTVKPEVQHHALEALHKGDPCPECPKGSLYKYEPARLLRITGQSPFVPTLHLSERLRCNACGTFFTATLPEAVKVDGSSNQKYGYSARTLIALYKYFAGAPFYRQGSLQDLLGVPMCASTAYDQCEYLANDINPVFKAMLRTAADAKHYHLDDTTHRILDQQPVMKKKRNSNKEQLRTGIYSSGIIARLDTDHDVVLFQTNIGHAGEFIDEVLANRALDRPPPLLMSDALPSNKPTQQVGQILTLCNAHARRQFVDIISHFPDEVAHVLQRYAQIWINDDKTADEAMSAPERLRYHRTHSLPIMQEILGWGNHLLATDAVEENSALGKAIKYFVKHYAGLTAFCTYEGAQLDNNRIEQALKLVVRGRKNAMFYKTATGAAVADVIMSMVATGAKAGINMFNYFNAIQENRVQVKTHPEDWLPWNYQG